VKPTSFSRISWYKVDLSVLEKGILPDNSIKVMMPRAQISTAVP
jgi:hypothetical protein